MKVRATQDGTYGGYFRHGPITGADGTVPGEVFEISDEVVLLREPTFDGQGEGAPQMEPAVDKDGSVMMERIQKQAVDTNGNPIVDEKHKPVMVTTERVKMRQRTTTHFAANWMEKMPDDAEVTYDYPKFEIPSQYREIKKRASAPVPAPAGQNLLPVI